MGARCIRRWRFGRRRTSSLFSLPAMMDFARIWQAADKIVYSKSLETASTPKTRLERELDPQSVSRLKAHLPHDISVSGPTFAAHAIRTGLVDEYHLLMVPIMLGGEAGPARRRRRMRKAGSPGRAPFCEWNGLSSLWYAGLTKAEAGVAFSVVAPRQVSPRPTPIGRASPAVSPGPYAPQSSLRILYWGAFGQSDRSCRVTDHETRSLLLATRAGSFLCRGGCTAAAPERHSRRFARVRSPWLDEFVGTPEFADRVDDIWWRLKIRSIRSW